MIKMMRIDDRLIHGQVAVVWSKHLAVNRIVVANDTIVNDEMQMMTLKMAVPSNIKALIKTVDDSIKLLNDPRAASLNILVVVSNPKDAYRINEAVANIPLINVGNSGRMGTTVEEIQSKEQIDKNIYVNEEDKKYFKLLNESKTKVNIQSVPTEPERLLSDILK